MGPRPSFHRTRTVARSRAKHGVSKDAADCVRHAPGHPPSRRASRAPQGDGLRWRRFRVFRCAPCYGPPDGGPHMANDDALMQMQVGTLAALVAICDALVAAKAIKATAVI